MNILSAEEIQEQLGAGSTWELTNNALECHFKFKDFNEAFGFLTRVALLSETWNHHPEWSGVYNNVTLRLTTHDAGGITEKDTQMALTINSYVQ